MKNLQFISLLFSLIAMVFSVKAIQFSQQKQVVTIFKTIEPQKQEAVGLSAVSGPRMAYPVPVEYLVTKASIQPEKTMYYVKIGNTISKLEDKGGYIIAAKRLGMESILIIPDGKVYRTVSIDLRKDDESLKDAIEVKLDEIIVAN